MIAVHLSERDGPKEVSLLKGSGVHEVAEDIAGVGY